MSLVCFEVFLCHPCSNHTKSGIVVTPGAVAWENLTGKVLSGLQETPSSPVLLHQAEHVVSRSMVLLLSGSIEHKIMWAAKVCRWWLSQHLHRCVIVLSTIWLRLHFHHSSWFGSNAYFWVAVMNLNLIGWLVDVAGKHYKQQKPWRKET